MQHSAEDKPCTETFFKHCWGVFCFQNGFGYCMSKAFGKMLLHLWRRGFLKSVKGQWWVFIWEKGQELALTMIVTANRPPRGREVHRTQEIKLPSWLQFKCEVKGCILKIAGDREAPHQKCTFVLFKTKWSFLQMRITIPHKWGTPPSSNMYQRIWADWIQI